MTRIALLSSVRKQSEKEILNQILEAVNYYGFFWRNNTGAFKAESSSGTRFIRFGLRGSADIIGVARGFFIAIEVKRKGNRQTAEQIAFQNEIRRRGGYYILAFSVEDAVKGVLAVTNQAGSRFFELLHEMKQLANGIVDEGREEIIAVLKELVKRYEGMDIQQNQTPGSDISDSSRDRG